MNAKVAARGSFFAEERRQSQCRWMLGLCGLVELLLAISLREAARMSDREAELSTLINRHSDFGSELIAGRTSVQWALRMEWIDPRSEDAVAEVPGLIAVLRAKGIFWFTQRDAAKWLGRLGPRSPQAIAALQEVLETPHPVVNDASGEDLRIYAAAGLALARQASRDAVPALLQIAESPAESLELRLHCVEALAQIGLVHPATIPGLMRLASHAEGATLHEELELRCAACQGLGLIGSPAAVSLPLLVRLLDQPQEPLRRHAVHTLGRFGVAALPAWPALFDRLTTDTSPAVRDEAEIAIAALGPNVLDELLAEFNVVETDDKVRLLRILERMGPAARTVKIAWNELFNDSAPSVRLSAAQARWKIDRAAELVLPTLLELLSGDDGEIRRGAMRQLIAMGPAVRPIETELRRLVESGSPPSREAARQILRKLPNKPAE